MRTNLMNEEIHGTESINSSNTIPTVNLEI